jgi:hypothetical protein
VLSLYIWPVYAGTIQASARRLPSPVYGGPLLVPLVIADSPPPASCRGFAYAVVLTVAAVILSFGDATPIFPLLAPAHRLLVHGPVQMDLFRGLRVDVARRGRRMPCARSLRRR